MSPRSSVEPLVKSVSSHLLTYSLVVPTPRLFTTSPLSPSLSQVKESDLERALTCLAKRFRLVCDSDRPSDVSRVQAVERKREQLDSPIRSKGKSH